MPKMNLSAPGYFHIFACLVYLTPQFSLGAHSSCNSEEPAKKYSPEVNTPTKENDKIQKMVHIQGGAFEMGSHTPIYLSDGEGPVRSITVKDFYLDVYEVSNRDFARFAEAEKYITEVISFS